MKLSKREKMLLIIVSIILCLVSYIFLFLQPTLTEISKLDSQNKSNQTTIQANQVLKATIDAAVKDIVAAEATLEEYNDNIKKGFDQPAVLYYLYKTMNNYGKKVMISFNGAGELGHIKYCNISVSMIGTYEGLKGVMKEFANSDYFIKVTQLVVDNQPTAEDSGPPSDESDTDKGSFADNFTSTPLDEEDNLLNIGMVLEFYNIGDKIPPDKSYEFKDGAVQYGGDIFN